MLEEKCGCTCVFPESELRAQGAYAELSEVASLRLLELQILDEVKLIIALNLTPGVLAEVHDFALDHVLAEKMLLLVPNWYSGYHVQSILRETSAEKHLFDPDFLKSCDCLEACRLRALKEKYLKRSGRRWIATATVLSERYRY